MFDQVQIRALAGPLKDIQRLVPNSLLHSLGCVLRVVVLLEGKPSPQSEVLSALEQVSSRISLNFAPFIFASILTSLPVPAVEKHPRSIMLPPPGFTLVGARVPPDVTLGIQAKEFKLGFIRPENLVSHGLRLFRFLLVNSKRTIMCLLLRSGFCLATLP